MTFEEYIQNVAKRIKLYFEEQKIKLPLRLSALVEAEMEGSEVGVSDAWRNAKAGGNEKAFDPAEATWSKDDKLRNQTGQYLKSLLGGNDSLTDIQLTEYGIKGTFGTKLDVHEKGMKIYEKEYKGTMLGAGLRYMKEHPDDKQLALSLMKHGREPMPLMALHFLYLRSMYPSNDFYKIMTLSVIKNFGITLPARPTLTPAFKHFEEIDSQDWTNEILNEILKETSGN